VSRISKGSWKVILWGFGIYTDAYIRIRLPPMRQGDRYNGEGGCVEFLAQEVRFLREPSFEQGLFQVLNGKEAIHG
jgi:hypothetical protein